MKKLTLNKFIEEIDKTEVGTFVELPGKIDIKNLNSWTHITKTRAKIYGIDCIVTTLALFRDANKRNYFSKDMLVSDIIALETPDGRKYFADAIKTYTGGKTTMPKLPNGWKVFDTEIEKWTEEYYQILKQEYDNAKVNNAIVKKVYNHFRSELDEGGYYRVAENIANFIEFVILTKDSNGKIKCNFTLDSNTLRIPSYQYYFGNTNDIGPRCHMNEIILHNETPKDVFDKVMSAKRDTDIRGRLLQNTLIREHDSLDKLFKINNNKKSYTTYEIMIEVKSTLTAIGNLLIEILETKNGKILIDFLDAKENYWKNISPLYDCFITLYKGRKERYNERTAHSIIIERALQDYCGDNDYTPVSKITIGKVSSGKDKERIVYEIPRRKKK